MLNDHLLSDRMAEILLNVGDIHSIGARVVAYVRGGIDMHELSYDEIRVADQHALSTELARRISSASPKHDASCA
ncbi:MAG: hypothetical protein EBS82_04390 [Methylocystaceae bacterium]|jgi:hypothetical protein|nr:hypothetical protein [Methylocystaceae bacterium]NBT96976.1 hypothetical protein [Methylocystaceae bacterium]